MWLLVIVLASVFQFGCAAATEGPLPDGFSDAAKSTEAQKQRLIDECAIGAHDCAPVAECIDTMESYACKCPPGYTGDGQTCSLVADRQEPAQPQEEEEEPTGCPAGCGPNAECVETGDKWECACLDGFQRDDEVSACGPSLAVSIEGGAAYLREASAMALILPPDNLLANPSNETGSDEGWTVQGCEGGWSFVTPGIFGKYAAATGPCRVAREQVVDLMAAGVDVAALDGATGQPRLSAVVFYRKTAPMFDDTHMVKFELLDANGGVVVSRDSGSGLYLPHARVGWIEWWEGQYPAGVRYVRLRQEAMSAENSDAFDGLVLDGAAVTVGERAQIRLSADGETWRDAIPYQPMVGAGFGFEFGVQGERRLFVEATTADGRVFRGSDSILTE
ncbi:EGF domain-containing protein [Sorangium sp. So ce1667]